MNTPLLFGVTVVYICVAVGYLSDERYGMALAFAGYAVANLGFIWDLR